MQHFHPSLSTLRGTLHCFVSQGHCVPVSDNIAATVCAVVWNWLLEPDRS